LPAQPQRRVRGVAAHVVHRDQPPQRGVGTFMQGALGDCVCTFTANLLILNKISTYTS
jgi:hypothetical protein